MSDDVRQAAERLRRWREMDRYDYTTPHEYRDGERFREYRRVADLERLAAAWEEDHANDAENALPLTADVLEASGWFFSRLIGGYLLEGLNFHLTGPSDVQFSAWHVLAVEREFGTIETVGDLRLLLRALHIDAVVVVPRTEDGE